MSRLIELVKSGASIEAVKADLWDNRGVDGYVNIRRRPHGMTALMCAAKNGDSHMVELLLKEGVDVNAQNNYGNSALILAVSLANYEVVTKLIEAGADINVRDNQGCTPLMIACTNINPRLVGVCLEAGAVMDYQNDKGETALSIATRNESEYSTDYLLQINDISRGKFSIQVVGMLKQHSPKVLTNCENYAVINGKRYLLVESPL